MSRVRTPCALLGLSGALALSSACRSAPPELVSSRTEPTAPIVTARESFLPREPRLLPAETLVRSYTAIFGDLMIPEHRAGYDASNRTARYFGWADHLAALGLPDYTRDHPRSTQTNTIMVAAFERLSAELCDRAAGRDLYPQNRGKPVAANLKDLAYVAPTVVFAFEIKQAPLSEADFGPRFDVLHRTFLGYPAALAPPERMTEFFALYKTVETRHGAGNAGKKGHAPHVPAWSAVCQGLARHPEFHHY